MEKTFSPIPKKNKTVVMDFPEAMRKIIEGKKITRLLWDDSEEYCLFKDGWLSIHTRNNFHKWLVNDGDLMATDWVEVKETN